MNFPRVLYKLINRDNGSSITLNDISPSGTFYAPPIGYDKSKPSVVRDMTSGGVMTTISLDLEFVKEGADFLRLAYRSRSVEAKVDLEEYRYDPNTDVKFLLDTFTFDFTQYKESENKVTCRFKSGGLNALIDSKKRNKYQHERTTSLDGKTITPIEKQDVALVSKRLLLISELETQEADSLTESFRMNFGSGNYREGHVGIPLTINFESDDMITNQFKNQFEGSLTQGLSTMVFYLNNDIQKELKIKFDLTFTGIYRTVSDLSSNAFFKVILETYENGTDLDIVTSKRRTLFEVLGDGNIVNYFFEETTTTISFDETITLEEGESLSLQWYGGANFGGILDSGRFDVDFRDVTCKINIDEDSVRPNSQTEAILNKDVGEQFLKIFTGEEGRYESDFFTNGDFKLSALTSGFLIRRYYDKNIEFSWQQWIDNCNALFYMGYTIIKENGIEKIVHEPRSYFFQNQVIIDLGEVSDINRYPLSEKICSSISTGYKKPSGDNLYEEIQGTDEPNIRNEYNTPITRTDEVYEIVSDFRADSTGKELARRQAIDTEPSKDTRYDKTIFNLDLKESDGVLLTERTWEDDFEELPEGIYSPETTTGLRFSPLNNLLRHGSALRSFLEPFRSENISFDSSVGNENLTTHPNGGIERSENESVKINDLDYPLYFTKVIEFKKELDFNIIKTLYGKTRVGDRLVPNWFFKIRFTNEFGQKENGFIKKTELNGEGSWELLEIN